MYFSKQVLLMFSLIPLLSSCIGVGVLYPKNLATIDHPQVGPTLGYYSPGGLNNPAKCSEIKSRWGDPNNTSLNGNETTLVYKQGLVWAGVMPIVVVPIPLALPVGRKNTTLICVDDAIIRATGTETGLSAAYCGVISERPDYGCKTE
jgi:hypothetical protein